MPGTDDLDALLGRGRRRRDLAAAGRAGRRSRCGPPRPASTCCWRSRSRSTVADADRVVAAVAAAGVASVVFLTYRFQHGDGDLAGRRPRRTTLAGGCGDLAGSSFAGDARSRARRGGHEPGAPLWDLGPHALSLLDPGAGPGGGRPGRRRAADDTVHLVLDHESGATSTLTLSHTVAPMSAGKEFWRARRRRPAGAAARGRRRARRARGRRHRARRGRRHRGAHPCDVGFGRDVVAVLAAAQRALASGCREDVGG